MARLQSEIDQLRAQLDALEQRVRIHDAAESFIAGEREIREGDYMLADGFPTRLDDVSSEGKWTYRDRHKYAEHGRRPEAERLYTVAEVAEIVARVAGRGAR